MKFTLSSSLLGLLLAVSALPAQQTDSAASPRPPKSSSTLITEDDVDKVRPSVASAYDVVRLLRPRWLRTQTTLRRPDDEMRPRDEIILHVFVNDHEMGGVNFLRSLPADQIYTLQFMSVAEVGARYGPSRGPGIIVTLRH